ECMDEVIRHIASVTRFTLIAIIALRPAEKTLADGRNAHISLHDAAWWVDKLGEFFTVTEDCEQNGELLVVCDARLHIVMTPEMKEYKKEHPDRRVLVVNGRC